mgnify:CR=1 FL=1
MELVIKNKKGFSGIDFGELWHYRELFYFLAWRDIKIRYKQTAFGIGWAILQPFLMMVVFSVFFSRVVGPQNGVPYPIFSYAGLLLWNIFSNSLNNASQSLVSSTNIIQKVYLPRIILPVASIIVTLVDFVFAFLIFCLILVFYRFVPNFWGFALLPFLILLTFVASLGLGLFLSAVNVKYRDVRYALPFFLQMLIFVTPVIYPVSSIPQNFQWILALNPMTGIIEIFKSIFLGIGAVNWAVFSISSASAVFFLLFGFWYFYKMEKTFADTI